MEIPRFTCPCLLEIEAGISLATKVQAAGLGFTDLTHPHETLSRKLVPERIGRYMGSMLLSTAEESSAPRDKGPK